MQGSDVIAEIAFDDNQIRVIASPEQPFSVPELTDSGRLGRRCGKNLCRREARIVEERQTNVKIPVSDPRTESGVDSGDDPYAPRM